MIASAMHLNLAMSQERRTGIAELITARWGERRWEGQRAPPGTHFTSPAPSSFATRDRMNSRSDSRLRY